MSRVFVVIFMLASSFVIKAGGWESGVFEGKEYVAVIANGKFSNPLLKENELKSLVQLNKDAHGNAVLLLSLFEYGQFVVVGVDEVDTCSLKLEVNDKEEFIQAQFATNKEELILRNTESQKIISVLQLGEDISLEVEINGTTYQLALSANGFKDAYERWKNPNDMAQSNL